MLFDRYAYPINRFRSVFFFVRDLELVKLASDAGSIRFLNSLKTMNDWKIIVVLFYYCRETIDDYVDIPLSQASRLFEIKGFEKNNPTVFYIHGFIEVAQQESIQVITPFNHAIAHLGVVKPCSQRTLNLIQTQTKSLLMHKSFVKKAK